MVGDYFNQMFMNGLFSERLKQQQKGGTTRKYTLKAERVERPGGINILSNK